MSDRPTVPVDVDLLADYGCGALAGTQAEARVAALIDSDPDWATAYRALAAADPLVRDELAGLAAAAEPMPTDVLDRALAALPGEQRQTAPVRRLPTHRARSYRRFAGWAAAAAAVVVVAAIGLGGYLTTTGGSAQHSADTAARDGHAPATMAEKRAEGDQGANPAHLLLSASGIDYTPTTLDRVTAAPAGPSLAASELRQVPAALSRLTAPAALDACLRAVTARRAGTAELVDYAHFEGRPALIVVLGGDTVVAGPSCGIDGADIRYVA